MTAVWSANGYASFEIDDRPRPISIGLLESAILQTVAYADSFDFPLSAKEIHRYLVGHRITESELEAVLARRSLVPRRLSRVGDWYTLRGREHIVEKRHARSARAAALWPEAVRYAQQIGALPFVRMVAVTGSLAVDNVEHDGDIDFLIVTADDHLWISRLFTIAVVRLAARRGVSLCPNYFLAERVMELHERDLYTAHEIVQMVPIVGLDVYESFRRANGWTTSYLPNADGAPPSSAAVTDRHRAAPASHTQGMTERMLKSPLGAWLERAVMRNKIRKFSDAQPDWSEACFTPDCCKGHFNLHRLRTLEAYQRRLIQPVP